MTRPAQKNLERRQLALVRGRCRDFLPDVVAIADGNERDEPDLIVTLSSGRVIGIEITALRDDLKISGFTPAQIEASRAKIIRMAKERHEVRGGPRIRVNAYVGPGPHDLSEVADFLVDMIERHAFHACGLSLWPSQGAPLELHLSFWPCGPGEDDLWTLGAVGETKVLSEELVADAVRRKSRRLAGHPYRSGFDEIRLLVVATLWPSSSDFVAPQGAADWAFAHPFDGVFVCCEGDDTLLRC